MILTTLSTLQRGQKISVMSLFTKTNMTSNGTKGEVPLYFKIMTTSLSNQSFFKNHSGPANNTTNFFRPKYWLTTFAILTPCRCYTFYFFRSLYHLPVFYETVTFGRWRRLLSHLMFQRSKKETSHCIWNS